MGRPSKYSRLRERAVLMVFDHAHEHSSQWATMRSVAAKFGCSVEALRRWVRQAERDSGKRPGRTTSEREELKRLQRENFELKRRMKSSADADARLEPGEFWSFYTNAQTADGHIASPPSSSLADAAWPESVVGNVVVI
jgi:transposase